MTIYIMHKFIATKDYPYHAPGKPVPMCKSSICIANALHKDGPILSMEEAGSIDLLVDILKRSEDVIMDMHPFIPAKGQDENYIWEYRSPSKDSLTAERLRQEKILS